MLFAFRHPARHTLCGESILRVTTKNNDMHYWVPLPFLATQRVPQETSTARAS